MVRKSFTPEPIINKLREVEVLLSQGSTIGEASRKIGVTEQTYYRWRREYGGMKIEQAKKGRTLDVTVPIKVIAATNQVAKLSPELKPRFAIRKLKPWSREYWYGVRMSITSLPER